MGLVVMKNGLVANRWSLKRPEHSGPGERERERERERESERDRERERGGQRERERGIEKPCYGKMCQNLMFCRVKRLFSGLCSPRDSALFLIVPATSEQQSFLTRSHW